VSAGVASHPEPATTAEYVIPELLVGTCRVIPQVNCLEHLVRCLRPLQGRTPAICSTKIGEFAGAALAAEWTSNTHALTHPTSSVQVGLGTHPFLINDIASCKTVQAIGTRYLMLLVARDQMGETPP